MIDCVIILQMVYSNLYRSSWQAHQQLRYALESDSCIYLSGICYASDPPEEGMHPVDLCALSVLSFS